MWDRTPQRILHPPQRSCPLERHPRIHSEREITFLREICWFDEGIVYAEVGKGGLGCVSNSRSFLCPKILAGDSSPNPRRNLGPFTLSGPFPNPLPAFFLLGFLEICGANPAVPVAPWAQTSSLLFPSPMKRGFSSHSFINIKLIFNHGRTP